MMYSRPVFVMYIKSVAMMYKQPVALVCTNPMTMMYSNPMTMTPLNLVQWHTGSLLEAWEAADPSHKSALVTEISHTLLTIDRDSAQALPRKDEPVPSAYERVSSMMHHIRKRWQRLSCKGARTLSGAGSGSGPVGPRDALVPSNGSHV